MKDDFPRNIHDRLFRNVFSNRSQAAALLAAALDAEIAEQINWRTLTPVPGTFVGPDLRQSETDLLFEVALSHGGEDPPRLYVLLEHQSSPDPFMAERMDNYRFRIRSASRRVYPERREVPGILPVVFYQGPRRWTEPTDLWELYPQALRQRWFALHSGYELLDQTLIAPEDVVGDLPGQVTQLLLMSPMTTGERQRGALVRAATLTVEVYLRDGWDAVENFYNYVLAAHDDEGLILLFRRTAQQIAPAIGDKFMSVAEKMKAESRAEGHAAGEAKGRAAEKVEVVEGFLKAGVGWDVVETATGLDEPAFQALRKQVASRP